MPINYSDANKLRRRIKEKMGSKTKRQITIETHSITIIRAKGKTISAYCQYCQQNVSAFSIEQFAAIFQMDLNEVCRQIESGKFHLVAIEDVLLVCGNSLDK